MLESQDQQELLRDDSNLAERLREIAQRHKRYGYRRALALLRRDRLKVNHKRVHRVWKQIGLQCPVRWKRKRSLPPGSLPQEATHPNHVWTYDFVFDTTDESFTITTDDLEPGEHVIALKISDDVGNVTYKTFELSVLSQ